MAQSDKVFSSPIARLYDSAMGPVFFEPYAQDLAARIGTLKPSTILETAAGSGIATTAILAALPSAKITATDLNQAMIDVARQKGGMEDVIWQACDATKLPFPDASFDLVACQYGAMFFPDKVTAYEEARRVLRTGGNFIFNVWGTLEVNPAPAAVMEILAQIFPNDPPTFMRRIPHGYNDIHTITQELEDAGFRNIKAERVTLPCRLDSPRHLALALCQGTPVRAEIEARDPEGLERVTDEVQQALNSKFGPGEIVTSMEAIVFEAVS